MIRTLTLFVLLAVSFVLTQDAVTKPTAVPTKGVYVIGFRTPGHVRASSPEIFHSAVADVRKILAEKKVSIVKDSERGFIENESQMSLDNMTNLAKEAGASTLLLVTVDRPASKWIKLTLEAYDLKGIRLWQESVDSGMSPMNGTAGYKKCFEKLNKSLPARIGGPGLPVIEEQPEKKS